mmetsp:Transcript_17144/g.20184  ORF Transcript_17144/g.20184 Transcript_17144/m.20184 type:complete len:424 (-) Transcript_17144:453-1724(-)|eukprot:CAMPEP_0114353168 /NCGR_PEP_ID=MMETSP0101-20121206/18465_1 /TAXON_ID=38822 ORGANISM="Pteridomonas danica, Strain PT" /NCGR_SAMPLE_ID=MMETSP0101 /ASSEMBLY_ACC=CAM_ASM_000211 /LENGTH=423 /DNA_ID=CAMNT_0001493877 /DNA_START=150 /DNA_END=1421 /DNA_ORIENTATION=-
MKVQAETTNELKVINDPTKPPFWLVSTVEVQKIDYATEITSVKLFSKWYFQHPSYFNRDCLKNLVTHDGVDITEEECDELLNGKKLNGVKVKNPDSEYFPVNPDSMMLNEIMGSQTSSGPVWFKLDLKNKTVMSQFVFTFDLHTPFQMQRFPFDRHFIPLCLATRKWKQNVLEETVKYKWVMLRDRPDWAPNDFPEDSTIISENLAWVDPDSEMTHLTPLVHVEDDKPMLCLRVQRDPSYLIFTITVPICSIVLLCLSSFFLEFNNASGRLEAVLISILAVSAYKTAIEGKLPVKSYLTFADKYFLFCYFFHFVLVAKIVMAFQGLGNGVGFFWYDTEPSEDDAEFEDTQTNRIFQNIDDVTSWFLVLVWSSLHLIIFIDTNIRQSQKVELGQPKRGFLDEMVRPPWDRQLRVKKNKFIYGSN